MSVRYMSPASRRACAAGAFLVVLLALSAWSLAQAPANALAGGLWKGTAEGIRVDHGELQSDEVTSTSDAYYLVDLSFFFSVNRAGDASGGGSGFYTDAHWHLSGVNGKEGSFDCEPPVSGEPFSVEVSGQRSGHELLLNLAIPDATETNEDYDCGANYTGFATSSHYMAESLEAVGGNELHVSTTAPTSVTLEKTLETGDSEDHKTHQNVWSFSVTPPSSGSGSGSGSGGGSGGGSGSRGGAGGSCSLSLTHVLARPSPGHAGKPIVVSFHVSAPAKAELLVSPLGGTASTVVTRNVPRGLNQLVWPGWLGTLPAAAGQYQLTVQAKACGKTRSQSVTVKTT
ncbi:MAG: hypothetical protein ABSG93_02865 [Solirubrobacteraceae bacterium]